MLKSRRWLIWFFMCFVLGGFIILTSEVREALAGEKEWIGTIDQQLLAFVVGHRTPALNGVAIDFTALGSAAGLSTLILFFCAFFFLDKKWSLILHMLLAVAGAGGLTAALKSYFERSRPDISLFKTVKSGKVSPMSQERENSSARRVSIAKARPTCLALA